MSKMRYRHAPWVPTLVLCAITMGALLIRPPAAHAQSGDATLELSLQRFLEQVEENSLQLENARADRGLAKVQENLAKTQLAPIIAGQVGYTRNLTDITQPFPVGVVATGNPGFLEAVTRDIDINSDNDLTVGVSVQQTIFDAIVLRGLEASRNFSELTGTIYEATRQTLLTEAKRLYFQVLLLNEVVTVRESSAETAYDNFVETQARLDTGLASPLEVLQAEVNYKLTLPETTQAERNRNIALQSLKSFAGIPQETPVQLTGTIDSYPTLPDFSQAFEQRVNRPDYQALQRSAHLRDIDLSLQYAKFYPKLSASFSYGWQGSSDQFDFSDGQDSMSVGVVLSLPIFLGGSRFVQVDEAKLQLQKAYTEIALKEDEIYTELDRIRLTLEESSQRITSAEQTRATAERAYQVMETSLDSGLSTQLELKDARVSLEAAQLSYVAAVFDYLSAYFDWQLAVGGGDTLPSR